MITDLPTTAITVTNILTEFLPTRWRQKSTGIDMEVKYVTVTVCIKRHYLLYRNICPRPSARGDESSQPREQWRRTKHATICVIISGAHYVLYRCVVSAVSSDNRRRTTVTNYNPLDQPLTRARSLQRLDYFWVSKWTYDTIRDAILTCAQKVTWVSLIYCTEPTDKNWK